MDGSGEREPFIEEKCNNALMQAKQEICVMKDVDRKSNVPECDEASGAAQVSPDGLDFQEKDSSEVEIQNSNSTKEIEPLQKETSQEIENSKQEVNNASDEVKPNKFDTGHKQVELIPIKNHPNIITNPSPAGTVNSHDVGEYMQECLCWGCGEFGQNGKDGKDVCIGATLSSFSNNSRHDRIKLMACGSSHTVVVTDSNQVFAWGNGSSGQLGCGDNESYASPQKVRLKEGHVITGLACGSRHTLLVTQEGSCFSFGNNFYAQLGYNFRLKNYKENQVLPRQLLPIAHHVVKSVACGEKHTLFLFETGQVAVCGQNSYGQLGTGDVEEILSPKVNERLEDIAHIACGAGHSIAATASGELYAWGNGRACGMRREDVLYPKRKLTYHDNIIMVAAGSGHSMALTDRGSISSVQ